MNCSPPGSSIHGIYQARILKWVADFLQGSPQPRNQPPVSCVGRQVLYHWTTREAQYTSLQNSKKCPLRDVTSGDQLHKAGQFSSGILNMEGLIVSKIWYYQAKKKKKERILFEIAETAATTSGFRTNRHISPWDLCSSKLCPHPSSSDFSWSYARILINLFYIRNPKGVYQIYSYSNSTPQRSWIN